MGGPFPETSLIINDAFVLSSARAVVVVVVVDSSRLRCRDLADAPTIAFHSKLLNNVAAARVD